MLHMTKRNKDTILHGTKEECENFIQSFNDTTENGEIVEVMDKFHSDTSNLWIYIIKVIKKTA